MFEALLMLHRSSWERALISVRQLVGTRRVTTVFIRGYVARVDCISRDTAVRGPVVASVGFAASGAWGHVRRSVTALKT